MRPCLDVDDEGFWWFTADRDGDPGLASGPFDDPAEAVWSRVRDIDGEG
jgi:hypothetical protein